MSDDLETRVSNAAQGISPQTKPDERRRYLGSLRERVLVRMTNKETHDPQLTALFLKHFRDYAGYEVLLNGHLADDFLGQVEAACGQYDVAFTLVNNKTAQTGPDQTAVLVVSQTALNRLRIEIGQVYPPEFSKEALPSTKPAKGGFWHRLFHGEQQ